MWLGGELAGERVEGGACTIFFLSRKLHGRILATQHGINIEAFPAGVLSRGVYRPSRHTRTARVKAGKVVYNCI